jgi:hypothetical protein
MDESLPFLAQALCPADLRQIATPPRDAKGSSGTVSVAITNAFAREGAWRENHRRQPNGTLLNLATRAALAHPKSQQWCGYWQRSFA